MCADFLQSSQVLEYFERLNNHRVDIVELFGGEGGVLNRCLKRGLTSGGNIGLVTSWGLLRPDHLRALYSLYDKLRPRVVVMAMPSAVFSKLNRCFAQKHPASFKRAVAQGTVLASVAAHVARTQVSECDSFLAEDPAESLGLGSEGMANCSQLSFCATCGN